MADIFDMDGCASQLLNAMKHLTFENEPPAHDIDNSLSLNYKLIDETAPFLVQKEDVLDSFEATDTIDDAFPPEQPRYTSNVVVLIKLKTCRCLADHVEDRR